MMRSAVLESGFHANAREYFSEPPSSVVEACHSLVSAVILYSEKEAIDEVVSLPLACWPDARLRALAETIKEMVDEGVAVEPLLLAMRVEAKGVTPLDITFVCERASSRQPKLCAQDIRAWRAKAKLYHEATAFLENLPKKSSSEIQQFLSDAALFVNDHAAVDEVASLLCLADVEPEAIDWLWRSFLPRGKIVLLDGDPGQGKSMLSIDLASRLSTGTPFPETNRRFHPINTVLLGAEDGLADTVRPRIEAAGGDLRRIFAINGAPDATGLLRPVILPDDIRWLKSIIRDVNAGFLVVDPLMAFLSSKTNAASDQDVRRALHALKLLAEELNVCVFVVRHLNKGGGEEPLYRGGGSIGIIGAARMGLLVGRHPENPQLRVLARTKSNLGAELGSLMYRILVEQDTPRIQWEGPCSFSARDLLRATKTPQGLDGASEFLLTVLADGAKPSVEIADLAEQEHIALPTLRRAKKKEGIIAYKTAEGWYWRLPNGPSAETVNDLLCTSPGLFDGEAQREYEEPPF